MKFKFLILIIGMFLFVNNEYSQSATFNVKSFTIKDKLQPTDPKDEQLGVYNNFELFMNKSDEVSINFSTEKFLPLILLVSPSGKKNAFNSKDGKHIDFIKKINETGNWQLLIIGGENAAGDYQCKVSFADSAAVNPGNLLSDCDFLRFVTEHSEADFLFIKGLIDKNFKSLKTKDFAVDSSYLKDADRLIIKLNVDDSEGIFNKLENRVANCFESWKIRIGKKRKTLQGFETTISIVEEGVNNPRFVKINLVGNPSNGEKKILFEFGKIGS